MLSPNQPKTDRPLPRFDSSESEAAGQEEEYSNSPSLAPLAADVEKKVVRSLLPRERRVRAVTLFALLFAPVVMLGMFEVYTLGTDSLRGLLPTTRAQVSAAKSWGTGLMAGSTETRALAGDGGGPLMDEEARELAASSLAQALHLARVACVDKDMPPTNLWVTIVVGQDGTVTSVAVEGATYRNPQVATCVGEIARNIRIPVFRGPPVTAGREVTLW